MIVLVLLVLIGIGIGAAMMLRGQRKDTYESLVASPVVVSRRCASERPLVRRFFNETLLAAGAIETALAAYQNRGLEELVRQASVRPDAPRSQQLMEAAQVAALEWVRCIEELADPDLDDIAARGVSLEILGQWTDRTFSTPAEMHSLAVQLRTIESALCVRGWDAVLPPASSE